MAAKKQQNGTETAKQPEPAPESTQMRTVAPSADPQPEPDSPTTIKVKPETKAKLDILKGMLNQPDYNSVLARIIELVPQQLSNEKVVHLKMPISRYRWLMAKQDSCDCRNALNDAKV